MRQIVRSALLIAALSLALWNSTSRVSTQSTPQYGVQDIGTLGGSSAVATAIDDNAFPPIAGYSATASGALHAFSRDLGGGLHDLGTLGGAASEGHAESNGGVAGKSQVASGAYHAFLAQSSPSAPGMIDLGTLGGAQSSANGLAWTSANASSARFVVVGDSLTSGNATTRAFLYDSSGQTLADLGASLGGPNTSAAGINSNGHVVGWADLPGGGTHHAFLYANGATQDLGTLGTNSEALAINDSDVIVGRSQIGATAGEHAFVFQNGAMQDLGTLGGANSEALAVSRLGPIAGWAETSAGERRAVLWKDGAIIDLNSQITSDSGWTLQAATGVIGTSSNNAIVGYGQLNGQTRAFFLTPPNDLVLALGDYVTDASTNFPNPHEAGKELDMAVSVINNAPYNATNIKIAETFTGAIQIDGWDGAACTNSGLQLTCTIGGMWGAGHADTVNVYIHATAAGPITHSATIVSADQPDPNTGNNSVSESNLAVSLSSFTLASSSVQGGGSVLGRTDITSPAPQGDARVTLTSSNPAIASVPNPYDVLSNCCGGTYREFYVSTQPVSTSTTVQISATYGGVTITQPLTITPPSGGSGGSSTPYGGTAAAIPGTIQAENFDDGGQGVAYSDNSSGNNGGAYRSTDVDIEATADTGGGYDVGWMSAGEWLNYTVNVTQAGTYTLTLRVASSGPGGTFHVAFGGVDKTGPMSIPDTGGWQTWSDITTTVSLSAGVQTMRFVEDANGATGAFGNLNYLRFVGPSGGSGGTGGLSPFAGSPAAVPGNISAANFDNGGEGVAYHDTTPGNSGGAYRTTDVDIETASDGGYDVGWTAAGEFLNYTVSVASSGSYNVALRVASPGGASMHVGFNGPSAGTWINVSIPATGGWQSWTMVNVPVTLGAGVQQMTLMFDTGGMNIELANVTSGPGGTGTGGFPGSGTLSPFSGTPAPVPGQILAANFDNGGEGVAYHDTSSGNTGGAYRNTDVDLEASSEGGYDVGWTAAGEWLNYTVNVGASGSYTVQLRVASPSGATMHVGFNGPSAGTWKTVTVPATGGWQAWTTVTVPVTLGAGTQQMTIWFDTGGVNYLWAQVQ